MKKIIIFSLFLTIVACSKIPIEEGFLKSYFCPTDNCEQTMINYVLNASEVKCAFYDFNLDNLIRVLKEKNADVLIFKNNYDGFGTPVKSLGLMHNKFCILDEKVVFTGSFNPTFNGNFKNNNNLVIINSKTIADNYLDEFFEIKKGVNKNKKTTHTKVLFNSFLVENYFCPEDKCEKEVLEELESANKSIYFMTFSFTDKKIAKLLVEKNNLIDVKGVMEKKRINMNYNVFHYLNNSGVFVVPDSNPATMHHKVFIIDNKTVITGSYNPTKSGDERNDENIIIIHNKEFANNFLEEFKTQTKKAVNS